MSYPLPTEGLDVTHVQFTPGAPGSQVAPSGFPNRLYSNPAIPVGELAPVYNAKGDEVKVTTQIDAQPLSSGAQYKYDRVPVWIHKPEQHVGERIGVYSLEHLNWVLRQRAMHHHMDTIKQTVRLQAGQKRKATDASADYALFPLTAEEFIRDFKFMGYVTAKEGQDPQYASTYVEDVTFTTQLAGDIPSVANYWGTGLRSSDIVGFSIQVVPWGDSGITSWEGAPLNTDSPPLKVLQIIPVVDKSMGGVFLGCPNASGAPLDTTDGDFLEAREIVAPTKTIELVDGELKETVAMDAISNREQMNGLKFDSYEPAYFLSIGRVQRTWQAPSPEEIRAALISYEGLCYLQRETKTVDLSLTGFHVGRMCV